MNRSDGKPVSAYVLAAWEKVRDLDGAEFADLFKPVRLTDGAAKKRRLALLCREVSNGSRAGGFVLSSLDAAAVLGVDQTAASSWLREFVGLKLLVRTRRGNSLAGRASEYRWVHGRTRRRSAPEGGSGVAARPLPA